MLALRPATRLTRTPATRPLAPVRRARPSSLSPVMATSSDAPAVELWVKGDPKTDTLLDCAFFCQGGGGGSGGGRVRDGRGCR